jgi:hypothetical protein
MDVIVTTAETLTKLLQPLSSNTQPKGNMPSLGQKQSNFMKSVVCESAFSAVIKHAGIDVNGAIAVEEGHTCVYVCAMGATVLDASELGITYRCRIRIIKKKQYNIALGVASQNTLRINKFQIPSLSQLGHGNYINFSHGVTFSHTDATMNYKNGPLTFKESEVVEMEFDTMAMVLHLRGKEKHNSFAVAPLPKDDCYRFVVYLSDIGDTVELLRSE